MKLANKKLEKIAHGWVYENAKWDTISSDDIVVNENRFKWWRFIKLFWSKMREKLVWADVSCVWFLFSRIMMWLDNWIFLKEWFASDNDICCKRKSFEYIKDLVWRWIIKRKWRWAYYVNYSLCMFGNTLPKIDNDIMSWFIDENN